MAKRDYIEYLDRGREVLMRQLECYEAIQEGRPVPYQPLTAAQVESLEIGLRHALGCQALEVKILSSMHSWPQSAVQMWQMRAIEQQEREAEKNRQLGPVVLGEGN